MILRAFLILIEVLFITVLNYYMASSYYSLDVLYCLPVIQTARFSALQSESSSGTYTLPIIAIVCAVAWSAAEAAVMWPSFPISAVLMNVLTRGVTFTIIARVIAKLWRDKESIRKDSLTGLANRLELSNRLEEMQIQSQASGSHYTLLFINIDRFRAFNDEFGHQSGDDVLILLANTLMEVTKAQDVACRIASDEFLVLLPNTDEKLINQLAIRFCKAAEKKLNQNGWHLTLSYGYTTDIGKTRNLEDLMRLATEKLKNNRKSINSIQSDE
jgi:diguanylate cyclase (GGDEF)-like protein